MPGGTARKSTIGICNRTRSTNTTTPVSSSISYAHDNDQAFRFLELPAELRNRIYAYVFTSEDYNEPGIWQIEKRTRHDIAHDIYNFPDENTSMLAILQTCRQIYNKAKTIPYNCNYTRFHQARNMVEFMGQLNVDQLHAIHRVAIDLNDEDSDY